MPAETAPGSSSRPRPQGGPGLLELFQAEWCPASRRVRQRLTELRLDFVARQVPAGREERRALTAATGADTVPVLVLEDGRSLVGEDEIFGYLDEHYPEPAGADAHRVKAETLRRRFLDEECGCPPADAL